MKKLAYSKMLVYLMMACLCLLMAAMPTLAADNAKDQILNKTVDSITLIDTSEAVVRQLKRQLEQLVFDDMSAIQDHGSVNFVSSKDDAVLLQMAQDLMHSDLEMHKVRSQMLGNIR